MEEAHFTSKDTFQRMAKINRDNIQDILALTPMQKGMLFHYLKEPWNDLYVEQLCLVISGEIERKSFEKAWNFVIETNEMLRTTFHWDGLENPIQIILKKHPHLPVFVDFSNNSKEEIEQTIASLKNGERKKVLTLQGEIPFYVMLCKVGQNRYELIISNHHMLYDGWSNGIILKEFFKTYADLASTRVPMRPIKTGFKEFVKYLSKRDNEKEKEYWRNYLIDFETLTQLSIKKRTNVDKMDNMSAKRFYLTRLEKHEKDNIEDFLKEHKITAASFFYSVWGILLQRYNNSDDVVFGTSVSGRPASISGIENMVGLFINTIPLRIQSNAEEKIIKVIANSKHWEGTGKSPVTFI